MMNTYKNPKTLKNYRPLTNKELRTKLITKILDIILCLFLIFIVLAADLLSELAANFLLNL